MWEENDYIQHPLCDYYVTNTVTLYLIQKSQDPYGMGTIIYGDKEAERRTICSSVIVQGHPYRYMGKLDFKAIFSKFRAIFFYSLCNLPTIFYRRANLVHLMLL